MLRPMAVSRFLCAFTLSLPLLLMNANSSFAQTKPSSPAKGNGVQKIGTAYVAPPPGLALFNQAIAATKAGKYAEAEKLYKKLLQTAPDAAAAWANLGLLVGRQGRIPEAIGHLQKATRVSPETGAFWAQLSAYQLRGKQWRAAEASARKALTTEPANPLAVANLADALFQQRRFTESIPVLEKLRTLEGAEISDHTEILLILSLSSASRAKDALVLAQNRVERLPKDVNAQLLLGDTARRAGKVDIAEKAYKAAASLDPKNQGAVAGMSVTAAIKGDRNAAIRLVNQRLSKEPNNATLHYQKGYLIYTDTSMPPEQRLELAEQQFRLAAALDPKNADYHTYAGIALMMQGPYPGLPADKEPPAGDRGFTLAENYLRGALNLSPRDTTARLGLASIAAQRKQNEDAIAIYKTILSYDTKNMEALRGIAGVYFAKGDKKKAYAQMENIATIYPRDIQSLAELASWYVADNRSQDAKALYGRILQRNPNYAPAHLALGRMLEEEKKPADAIAQYRSALATDPRNKDAALLLGNILIQQNKPNDAIEVYRAFLNVVPDNNPVRWQLATILKTNGHMDQAIAELHALILKKDDPNRTLYLLSVPRFLIEDKKYGEAIRTLQQLKLEHPKEMEVNFVLADAYEKADMKDKAEETLREIVTQPPDPGTPTTPAGAKARQALGEMYERASEWSAAANQYEDILRLDAMDTTALFALSRVREKEKKPDAAAEFLEALTTLDDKTPSLPAVGGIHQLYLNLRQLDRWREFTKRLLTKYPDNRDARYIRARSLTEDNNDPAARKEAITLYQQIVQKAPGDREAQRNLAREFEALGQKTEALSAYRAILRVQPQDTDALASIQRLESK